MCVVVLQIMLDVAGLYLATGDLDACQHQLMTLLKNDKENDSATIVSLNFLHYNASSQ